MTTSNEKGSPAMALLPEEVEAGWQPIETAPFDQRIFLWCTDLFGPAIWNERMGRKLPTEYGVVFGIKRQYGDMASVSGEGLNGDWHFSHWMPLPGSPILSRSLLEKGSSGSSSAAEQAARETALRQSNAEVTGLSAADLVGALHAIGYQRVFNAIGDAVSIWPEAAKAREQGLGISISVERFIAALGNAEPPGSACEGSPDAEVGPGMNPSIIKEKALVEALTELATRLDLMAQDRQDWADHPEIGGKKPPLANHLRGKRYGYSHAAQLIRAALQLATGGRG